MALFNTLFLFPFAVAHGTNASAIAALPLATIHRWYWRVSHWQTVLTALGATVTETLVPLNASGVAIGGEEDLLSPCQIGDPGSVGLSVSNPQVFVGTAGFYIFDLGESGFSPYQRTVYDPGSQAYFWSGATIRSATIYTQHGYYTVSTDTLYQGQPCTVPLTVDGLTVSIPATYVFVDSDGNVSAGPGAPEITWTITPVAFWGWGGKYDPTTGARL